MQQGIAETEWSSHTWARIAGAAGIFAIMAILVDRSPAWVHALAPLNIVTASFIAQILDSLGMNCQREMATLVHPNGFGYEIGFACTGVIPAGLLATAMIAAGGPLRARLCGATMGAAGVLVLNLIRLVSLFYIGVLFPRAFGIAHSLVWQGLTVLFVAGFFHAWHRCRLCPSSGNRVD
jgi:exosortase/archaeosortase family protein